MANSEQLSPLLLGLWVTILAGYAYFVVWLYVKLGRRPFNFFITDIWASMLGLAPSIWFAVHMTKGDNAAHAINWLHAGSLVLCQILGQIAGRLAPISREGESAPRRLDQFICVAAGGLFGAMLSYVAFGLAQVVSRGAGCCLLAFGLFIGLPWIADVFRKRPIEDAQTDDGWPDDEV